MMFISVIALALFLVFYLTGKDNNQNVNINREGNVINNSQTKKKSNFTTILNIGVFLIIYFGYYLFSYPLSEKLNSCIRAFFRVKLHCGYVFILDTCAKINMIIGV